MPSKNDKRIAKNAGKKNISEVREMKGQSNAGKYPGVKDFAGPNGTFPINTKDRARNALARAHNAKNPSAIKKAVYEKYPSLKPEVKKGKSRV